MTVIFNRDDAAEFLKMPVSTIDYLVQTKQIPFSRLGQRSVRFSKDRLEKWFNERESVEYHARRRKRMILGKG